MIMPQRAIRTYVNTCQRCGKRIERGDWYVVTAYGLNAQRMHAACAGVPLPPVEER